MGETGSKLENWNGPAHKPHTASAHSWATKPQGLMVILTKPIQSFHSPSNNGANFGHSLVLSKKSMAKIVSKSNKYSHTP